MQGSKLDSDRSRQKCGALGQQSNHPSLKPVGGMALSSKLLLKEGVLLSWPGHSPSHAKRDSGS